MKFVGYFFAITLLTSGVTAANATSAALVWIRGRESAAHGDEGVRFACDRRQIREIKAGMSAYLRSLDIPEEAVLLRERPAQGVLVYTLDTPAQETSTLDLASRSAMGTIDQVESAPQRYLRCAGHHRFAEGDHAALLQHGRLTELKGPACSVDALADHVALRQNIVAWAETLRWRWPDGGPAQWNSDYWSRGTPKQGVSLRDVIRPRVPEPERLFHWLLHGDQAGLCQGRDRLLRPRSRIAYAGTPRPGAIVFGSGSPLRHRTIEGLELLF